MWDGGGEGKGRRESDAGPFHCARPRAHPRPGGLGHLGRMAPLTSGGASAGWPPLAEGPGACAGPVQTRSSIAQGADLFAQFGRSAPGFDSGAGGRDQDRPARSSCAGRKADGDGLVCMRRPGADSPLRRGIAGSQVAAAAAWTSHRRGFSGLRAWNPNAAAGPPGRGLAVSLHGNRRSSHAQRGSQRRTARTMSGTSIRIGSPR